MKDDLGGAGGGVMMRFSGIRAKTYNYLDDGSVDKKSKRHKKVYHKKKLKFENYKNFLEAIQLDNKINYTEKNKEVLKKMIDN